MIRKLLNKNKLQPVILSGGSGTRLWPLSRESFPKQYINLNPENPFSLLQKTQKRLEGLDNIEDPIIICNQEQRFIVAEQMREIEKYYSTQIQELPENISDVLSS